MLIVEDPTVTVKFFIGNKNMDLLHLFVSKYNVG